jgi:hypothetical protein
MVSERVGGRLEATASRALRLLGGGASTHSSRTENATNAARSIDESDARAISGRIRAESSVAAEVAAAAAQSLIETARSALLRLASDPTSHINDSEAIALESVIHVRGRPALRVFANRLEALTNYPASEFWHEIISAHEENIIVASSATGAVMVSVPSLGLPPWLQGSAWLVAPDRVVTNRHVLTPDIGRQLYEGTRDSARLCADVTVSVELAHDSRTPQSKKTLSVTGIGYVASQDDAVDIAVLAVAPALDIRPIRAASATATSATSIIVVGHPAPLLDIPSAVQAVFGNPDGRKRVSFGNRMSGGPAGELLHDASTIGGFSGGPVVKPSTGEVLGLHFFGDPSTGNRAVSIDTIRDHPAFRFMNSADT